MEGFRSIILCLLISVGVSNKIRCKSCAGVPMMEDCDHTITCGSDEECYTKRTVGTLGNVLYESGCISKQTCTIISSGKRSAERSRRDSVTCFQCCSSSDICNAHLCTNHPHIDKTTMECFACDDVIRPEDCTYLASCGQDTRCSTSMYVRNTSNQLRYRLSCSRTEVCAIANATEASNNMCLKCCDTPYCNTQLCGFLDKALPMFATKPQSRNVLLNESIALHCRPMQIAGMPVTVTWTHELNNHTVTEPPVLYLEENQIANMTITSGHYGVWTCTLRNKNGAVTATSTVLPPIPIHSASVGDGTTA